MEELSIPKVELETHQLLEFAASVCGRLISLPLKLDLKESLVKSISPKKFRLYQFMALFDLVNRSCRTLAYAWCLYQNRLSINQIVWGAILFATFVMTYTIQVNMITRHKAFISWINVFIHLGAKLESNHSKIALRLIFLGNTTLIYIKLELSGEHNVYRSPLFKFGYFPCLIPYAQGFILLLGFLIFPKSLTLFQPLANIQNNWEFVFYSFLEIWSGTYAWSVGMFRIVSIIWMISFVQCWLQLLRGRVEKRFIYIILTLD